MTSLLQIISVGIRQITHRSIRVGLALLATLLVAGCDLEMVGLGGGSKVTGSVSLYWSEPLERVNGDLLEPGDITGYVIRYRQANELQFQMVYIDNSITISYHFDEIINPEEVVFQVAAVDKNGIYSDFVTASR